MNKTLPIALILLPFAGGTAAHAEHPWLHDHIGVAAHAGSFGLEGPAETAGQEGEEEDVDMFGLRAEGHLLLRNAWYTRGVADFSRLDGDAGLLQLNASIGTFRTLATWDASNLYGYVQTGVEYVRTSDLDGLAAYPAIAGARSGDSGDEFGATIEAGLSYGFRGDTRVDVFAKYLTLGDGGVSFGVRASRDLNEAWTLTGGVDAVWVQDVTQVDLDFQRFSLGVVRKF